MIPWVPETGISQLGRQQRNQDFACGTFANLSLRFARKRGTMSSTASLLWTVLFSSIGLGYFVYGKKQKKGMPFVCGIGLMVFPYFVSNASFVVIIGGLLAALPYFIRY
jgi:hypothetical protein